MGDLNQYDFISSNKHIIKGPILEVGSKNYGNVGNYRKLLKSNTYIGIDQEEGEGVDISCDFSRDYDQLISCIGIKKFKTIICFSMLEHCRDPFKIAHNISMFVESGGLLLVSVPFVWNIHSYPDDYWRFTPSALKILFNEFRMIENKSFYSTKIRGETYSLSTNLLGFDVYSHSYIVKTLMRFKLLKHKYPYVLCPVMVNGLFEKI